MWMGGTAPGVPAHQQSCALSRQSAQDRLEDVIPHTAGLVDDIQHPDSFIPMEWAEKASEGEAPATELVRRVDIGIEMISSRCSFRRSYTPTPRPSQSILTWMAAHSWARAYRLMADGGGDVRGRQRRVPGPCGWRVPQGLA